MSAKKSVFIVTAFSAAAFAVCTAMLKASGEDLWLTLAITFGTVFYHLAMRLLVGLLFNIFMHNKANLSNGWYHLKNWEKKLYRKLRIKNLIGKLPTYETEFFSLKKHTPEEVAGAMCQAELVHETIAVLSFLPLIEAKFFSPFWVFLVTSLAAAAFDMIFVIAQRYNRERIMKMLDKNIEKLLTIDVLWVILSLCKGLEKESNGVKLHKVA